jgi:hypothetical protein
LISGFGRDVDELCAPLGYDAAPVATRRRRSCMPTPVDSDRHQQLLPGGLCPLPICYSRVQDKMRVVCRRLLILLCHDLNNGRKHVGSTIDLACNEISADNSFCAVCAKRCEMIA